jgi:hypothetical protein
VRCVVSVFDAFDLCRCRKRRPKVRLTRFSVGSSQQSLCKWPAWRSLPSIVAAHAFELFARIRTVCTHTNCLRIRTVACVQPDFTTLVVVACVYDSAARVYVVVAMTTMVWIAGVTSACDADAW